MQTKGNKFLSGMVTCYNFLKVDVYNNRNILSCVERDACACAVRTVPDLFPVGARQFYEYCEVHKIKLEDGA